MEIKLNKSMNRFMIEYKDRDLSEVFYRSNEIEAMKKVDELTDYWIRKERFYAWRRQNI